MARIRVSKVIVTEKKEQGIFNDVGLSILEKFTFVEQCYHFFIVIYYKETMEII